MKKILGCIMLFIVLSVYASDRILGVWDWKITNGYDPRKCKIFFKRNGLAIYKMPDVRPVSAKWHMHGDTLIISSEKFIWDRKFEQDFAFSYQLWHDPNYSPDNRGKLLESPGEKEIYILNDSFLIPLGKHEYGLLQKTEEDSIAFSKFNPYLVSSEYYRPVNFTWIPFHDIQHNTQSIYAAQNNDSLLREAMKQAKSNKRKISHLLEDIPNVIDSIEFKLVDFNAVDYFAIDRKAFDSTFDSLLKKESSEHQIIHIMTADTNLISTFCGYLLKSVPFPSEAVQITPNNAWRQSNGNVGSTGIYTDKRLNNDPLEVRGKIVIYHNGNPIICFISRYSIDYKSHRYELSSEMHLFLYLLNIMAEYWGK